MPAWEALVANSKSATNVGILTQSLFNAFRHSNAPDRRFSTQVIDGLLQCSRPFVGEAQDPLGGESLPLALTLAPAEEPQMRSSRLTTEMGVASCPAPS